MGQTQLEIFYLILKCMITNIKYDYKNERIMIGSYTYWTFILLFDFIEWYIMVLLELLEQS